MTTPISSVTSTVGQPPLAGTRSRTTDNGGIPDFGPAATFTAAEFDAASQIKMYNRSGSGIALTQWLNSSTLPVPESVAAATG